MQLLAWIRGRSGAQQLELVCKAITLLACTWFALAAAWDLFAIPGGGHNGAGASGTAMMAEQLLRWKIVYPTFQWHSSTPPPQSAYYFHHPYGMYWLSAGFFAVFGHQDFVIRLPAVLMSAATPPLLYLIARERWGVVCGMVSATSFTVVPIALGFANFHNLEVMCIFGCLLFFWGHARHESTSKFRYLAASLLGVLIATSADWVGYLMIAVVLGWAFVRAFLLPARLRPARFAPYAQWWALSVALALATLSLWLWLFFRANGIADWLGSAENRGGGSQLSLRAVLDSRKSWIDFSFTPLAIALGKLALPVAALRVLILRRDEELFSLAILFGAAFQYVAFKQGADVHIFWPHYFAAYYALALAQLVSSARALFTWLLGKLKLKRALAIGAGAGFALGLLPSLAMFPDGVRALRIFRATGGRYNDNGRIIRSHVDLLYVLRQVVMPAVGEHGWVEHHASASWGWEHDWVFQSPNHRSASSAPERGSGGPRVWIARASGLVPALQRQISDAFLVRVYGDVWVVDVNEPKGPLEAYSLQEREPNLWQWYLAHGVEPVRSVAETPDPFLTWDWRVHLEQPAAFPTQEPKTLDELRIQHNVAVARGDAVAARRVRKRVTEALDRRCAARFDQGVTLIGSRVTSGVQPRIEAWFEAQGPTQADAGFAIRSVVERKEPLSLMPVDPVERDMAWPPPLSPKLWKAGFIYAIEAVQHHRIGYERYFGYWGSRDASPPPALLNGNAKVDLAVVR